MCYSNYDCATKLVPNENDNPCNVYYDTFVPDRQAPTGSCASYIQCNRGYITTATKKNCASGTYFLYGYGCASENKCTGYQCQAVGYVTDPTSSDCSTYLSCERFNNFLPGASPGGLYPFVRKCAENSKYNPFLKKCDSFHTCGGSDPHSGVDPCLTYNWQNPYVVNNLQPDCKTYINCAFPYGHILKESCPENSRFSPNLLKCYYNYKCTQPTCSKDPCQSGDGIYLDDESSDCRTFLQCKNKVTTAGIYNPYIEKLYCPRGSFFNPQTNDCDSQYVCPGDNQNYCYPLIAPPPPPPVPQAG